MAFLADPPVRRVADWGHLPVVAYLTTRLTSLPGTTTSLTTSLPSMWRCTAALARNFDTYHDLAFQLVTSRQARQAFDLSRESPRLRDRYGWSAFGQGSSQTRRPVIASYTSQPRCGAKGKRIDAAVAVAKRRALSPAASP